MEEQQVKERNTLLHDLEKALGQLKQYIIKEDSPEGKLLYKLMHNKEIYWDMLHSDSKYISNVAQENMTKDLLIAKEILYIVTSKEDETLWTLGMLFIPLIVLIGMLYFFYTTL